MTPYTSSVAGTTTTTEYAVDGWNPAKAGSTGNSAFDVWAVMNGSGNLQTYNVNGDGIDQILARVDNATNGASDPSGVYFDLTDDLGSVRDVINTSGTVKDSIQYDAFGNITDSDANYRGMYSYTGRQFDVETDLQYNRVRWYDPTIGRWISQDPMQFAAGDSNLYRYVTNTPTNATDPSGLDFIAVESRPVVGKFFEHLILSYYKTNQDPAIGSTLVIKPKQQPLPTATADQHERLGQVAAAYAFRSQSPRAAIVNRAKNYAYAEQPGQKGVKNWPNSYYDTQNLLKLGLSGTNDSNTFVKFILTSVAYH